MRRHILLAMFLFAFGLSCGKSGAVTAAKAGARDFDPEPPSVQIYFPFASDMILPEAEISIEENARFLGKNPSIFIILEGHCDEVGPSEFNMELGDRRARAVKARLIEHGVRAERIIMVVSYGSTRPLNPGHRVEDLRQNRRVEFVVR